jgi:hypothetical protein
MGNVLSIPIGHLPGGNSEQNDGVNFYEQRRDRVAALIRTKFGEGKGAYAAFASEFGIAPPTVSRWFMSADKEGHRNIGEEIARRIEKKYKLPPGYLVMPEHISLPKGSVVVQMTQAAQPWPFPITREQYEAIPDLGKGEINLLMKQNAAGHAEKANPRKQISQR